jgi:pilus assembly protein CpaB
MRPTIILGLGLVASVVTATLVYRAVQPAAAPPVAQTAEAPRLNKVVLAANDLPLGTTLDAHHVKAVDWPAGLMPQDAYASPETLIGRVTISRIVTNEPLTNDKLAPVGTRGLLPLIIEPGMRATTVRVNEVAAVGGFIVPGSRVDVLLTTDAAKGPVDAVEASEKPSAAQQSGQHQTQTLLQNVTVLALGQMMESNNEAKPPAALTTATLLVTPEHGELLALATSEGSLQLVLRNFADNVIVASQGKRSDDLFAANGRADRNLEPPQDQVEVIRGAERLVLRF